MAMHGFNIKFRKKSGLTAIISMGIYYLDQMIT